MLFELKYCRHSIIYFLVVSCFELCARNGAKQHKKCAQLVTKIRISVKVNTNALVFQFFTMNIKTLCKVRKHCSRLQDRANVKFRKSNFFKIIAMHCWGEMLREVTLSSVQRESDIILVPYFWPTTMDHLEAVH